MSSLRFRVSAVAVVAVIAVLATAGVALVLAQRSTLRQDLDENLARQADRVAGQLRAGERVDRSDLLADDVAVLVSGPQGDQVAGAPGMIDRLFRYGPAPTAGADATTDLPGPEGGERVLSRTVDQQTIWVAAPLDDVRDSTAALVRSLLIAVPVSAAVLAALVWWTVGRTLRPVEDIRAEVERISGTRLERRVPEPGTSDEIARLAHTMNDMLDRLEESVAQQRAFVADASHELRSPLARIRAELEVDSAHPESADPAGTAASVLDETVRLQRLVDDLLLLARGDAGVAGRGPQTSVDLDELVERLVHRLRGQGAGPRVDTRGVGPVQVRGDPAQLDRLVANLLENAVRHARAEVVVTVREIDGSRAELTVRDDGPGIPPDQRERVFERFTRLDESRSGGGAGLGLAIARDVAERHGGTVAVADVGPPGAVLVLTLPLAADAVPAV